MAQHFANNFEGGGLGADGNVVGGSGNMTPPPVTPEPAAPTTRLGSVDSEPPSFYENGVYRSNPKYQGFAKNMTNLGMDAYYDRDPTTGAYRLKSQLPGMSGDRTNPAPGAAPTLGTPSAQPLGLPLTGTVVNPPLGAGQSQQQPSVAGGYIFSQNPQLNPKGVVSA